MVPEVGQRFGRYEILGRLGGGGMGLVLRAWDDHLHREVAVKLLADSFRMPGMRERFLQEARAASALNHPNICTVFDIGERDGDPYLVMELLEGETLKDRIARGALSVEEIVRYAEEIADALSVAHAKGIVHRDIKPANIFLVSMPNGRSQVKMLDFGLAKLELGVGGGWMSRALDLTLAGSTVGTLAYMSPEQARGESLDLRSDLFSLGVVLYEMATRQVPFRGATSALMFAQLFEHDPESVRDWNAAVPRELERVILKLLAKDRKSRLQSAGELREALEKIDTRTRRGWLNRTAEAVPLVRAKDPVARRRMVARKTTQEIGGVETRTAEASAGSSADNLVIRPMRIQPEDAPQDERSVVRSAAGEAAEERPSFETDIAATNGTSETWAESEGTFQQTRMESRLSPEEAGERETILRPSASGSMQFEHGLNELDREEVTEGDGLRGAANAAPVAASRRTMTGVTAAGLLLFVVGGLFVLLRSGALRSMVLGPKDHLLLTAAENRTQDKSLDGILMPGLEIALQQSKKLNVLGGDAYRAGLRQLPGDGVGGTEESAAQRVAQRLGAKAYLYGEISGGQAPYTVSVDVLKTDTNDKVARFEEEAASRDEVPAAIGRLAQRIREQISEDGKADAGAVVAFGEDATRSVDALRAYSLGEAARLGGRHEQAIGSYKLAAAIDPGFTQALIALAWMYRADKAELPSMRAAEQAKAAAEHASDKVKLLARFCYEMNGLGDVGKARETIREYVAKYPEDESGMKNLSRVLGAEGYLPESLMAAQQGYGDDPFDAATYNEAEDAMVGLDRYDSVLQLEAQARREGVEAHAGVLAAAYLGGHGNALAEQTAEMTSSMQEPAELHALSYAELDQFGRYLDGTGRMGQGMELWRTAAERAEKSPEPASAAASMLAQGALDRAMVERCTVALALVGRLRQMPKGPEAAFDSAMAAALCGDQTYAENAMDKMEQEFPQNTEVAQYYIPEIRAAAAIGVNEPARALVDLNGLRWHDEAILTAYLRGSARLALGQNSLAAGDFLQVLKHRGATWKIAGTMYPMAEIELGRAYAANRDKADSVAAYRRFLDLWAEADRGQPLMFEAIARSR